MKRIYSMQVVIMVCIAGCIFSNSERRRSDPDTIGNLGIGANAYAFMPMKPGQVWEYSRSFTETRDGETYSNQEATTHRCVSNSTMLDASYFVLQYSPENYSTFWYNGNDVYMIVPLDFARAKPAGVAAAEAVESLVLHESEQARLWYRFDVPAGTSWISYERSWVPSEDDLDRYDKDDFWTYKNTARYLGTEAITTPTGTFAGCMKFEHVAVSEGRDTVPDDPWTGIESPGTMEYTTNTTTYTWFAPDIGMIKETETTTSRVSNNPYDYSSYTEMMLESSEYAGAIVSKNEESFSITGKSSAVAARALQALT